MNRPRTVSATMDAPAHNGVVKRCVTMTEAAIHTVKLPEGHFAALVLSRPNSDMAAIAFMDREEVEAHITLLRNAMEDAERLDTGKEAIHATESLRRS
jgi:hypothetical protein